MACKNTTCSYHAASMPNGCNIFPGESWTKCPGSTVRAVATKPTTQKAKGN